MQPSEDEGLWFACQDSIIRMAEAEGGVAETETDRQSETETEKENCIKQG